MASPKYFVVGLTHVDLAWKKDREEHREILESFTLRLLDVLDHHPTYTYVIEQAAHYHALAERRPDLIARLRDHAQQGRIEFVGGLASTLECNGPSGESFVRNQLLGLGCVEELFGAPVRAAYLIDTFGVHAQVPQILRQFGFEHLLANRFGGTLNRDTFVARGLDGSRLLVTGRDVNSPYVAWDRVFFGFVQDHKHIKGLFDRAAATATEGPCLVMPYTEYDGIASTYTGRLVEEMNGSGAQATWAFATLTKYFDALSKHNANWPEYAGDLNPEFTGTFGQRIGIRCLHRKAENALLDAEKWATLLGLTGWREEATESWWKMAFAQSHDVYTGSHPTSVYEETMGQLADVEQSARTLLQRSANELSTPGGSEEITLLALNPLPWSRDAVVKVALPEGLDPAAVAAIRDGEQELPFEIKGRELSLRAIFPGISAKRLVVTRGGASRVGQQATDTTPAAGKPSNDRIANEFVAVCADTVEGLRIDVIDPAGGPKRSIHVGLVLQEDRGSFQIEELAGGEVPSEAAGCEVDVPVRSSFKERISIRGRFPKMWMKNPDPLDWELECTVYPGRPGVDLVVRLDWRGEASRVRLKVRTECESSTGIFEIPFGAVRRQPYHSRTTARGEWPVHRWVAVEEDHQGVALINTGHMGAEVAGGAIWATLLRAPSKDYAGMVADETSSQHGQHAFHFNVLPYTGSWTDGQCIQLAQDVNQPVECFAMPSGDLIASGPLLSLEPSSVVLSGLKTPEDGTADEVIVGVYEATGNRAAANLFIKGARAAWHSDLPETRGSPAECVDERVRVTLEPFEIKTLRIGITRRLG